MLVMYSIDFHICKYQRRCHHSCNTHEKSNHLHSLLALVQYSIQPTVEYISLTQPSFYLQNISSFAILFFYFFFPSPLSSSVLSLLSSISSFFLSLLFSLFSFSSLLFSSFFFIFFRRYQKRNSFNSFCRSLCFYFTNFHFFSIFQR